MQALKLLLLSMVLSSYLVHADVPLFRDGTLNSCSCQPAGR